MSAVLDIDNLLESPLADLHALAGELDIEGYRLMKKGDLTIAILEARGAIGDEIRPAVEAKAAVLAEEKAAREKALAEQEEREEAEREAAREARAAERAREPRQRGGSSGGRSRGSRGGRGRSGQGRDGQRDGDRKPRERAGAAAESSPKGEKKSDAAPRQRERKPDAAPEATVAINGVFEPGSGGGGRLRTDLSRRVRGDADVPRGEVRRWNLQRGDLITGQAKKARRGRTDFVVASIENVNGQTAEQRKQKSPAFEERPIGAVADRYAKKLFKHAPIGKGSRAVVTGPTRAAATEMLEKLAAELAASGVVTTLVIAVSRPGQSVSAGNLAVVANNPDKGAEDIKQPLELVLERDKRLAESGRDVALLIDGLDLLDAASATEVFAAGRNLEGAGSLTVIASAGPGSQLEAAATTIAVVATGRKLKIDKKASWSQDK